MILGIVLGAVWFAIYVITHLAIFAFRQTADKPHVQSICLVSAVVGNIVTITVLHIILPPGTWTHGGVALGIVFGLLMLAAMWVLYMPAYYTVSASLSVQSLILLNSLDPAARSENALRATFASKYLVGQRLETMRHNGFLVRGGNHFALTPKGKRVAEIFKFIKEACRLGKGG